MPRVHAVTVHHRGKEMLGACLDSLLGSTGVELEVVVVANACFEELPDLATASSHVHVVRSTRSIGFAAANNLGVRWAHQHLGRADYYYFVNNDTWSAPDALERLVAAVVAEPKAAIAGPRLLIQWAPEYLNSLGLNITEDGWGWDEGIGIRQEDYGLLPPRRRVVAVTGSALLVAADVLAAVGGWTELYDYYFEDVDLCLKAAAAGWEAVVEPTAVVLHHVSATMTLGSEHKLFLFWRNRLLLALVHWPYRRLGRVLRRVVGEEIIGRMWQDSRLQRKALAGAMRKLPKVLLARARQRGRCADWWDLLRPAGSVPVITLPTPPPAGAGASPSLLPAETWAPARALAAEPASGRTVLLLGWAPLPFEDARMNYAPGARTWQLARPLVDDGHRVCVVCARIADAYQGRYPRVAVERREGVLVYWLERDLFDSSAILPELVRVLEPEVVVGASAVPSLRAVQLAGSRPVWVDLFGDPMAEAQALSLASDDGDQLGAYRDLLATVLERGDAFSVVSERQRWAAIGQLGLAGRLNRATAGHELVFSVPCAVEAGPAPGPKARLDAAPDDDFVVLWSGGYNTWCDVATLYQGLEVAMAACPRLCFVSTGGEIAGHDDGTYRRFADLVQGSPFRGRCNLLGCLPAAEAVRYQARADLAVVTELPLYERALGSSGRLISWLGQGLPVVCTAASELGEWVARHGVGLTYPAGDGESLGRLLVEAAADPQALRQMAARARELVREEFSPAATIAPLRRWVREARRAPDRGLSNPISLLADRRLAQEWQSRFHEVRSELGDIHQSRMWRLWMLYFRVRDALLSPLRWVRRGGG